MPHFALFYKLFKNSLASNLKQVYTIVYVFVTEMQKSDTSLHRISTKTKINLLLQPWELFAEVFHDSFTFTPSLYQTRSHLSTTIPPQNGEFGEINKILVVKIVKVL
jgi:hypothetical protein